MIFSGFRAVCRGNWLPADRTAGFSTSRRQTLSRGNFHKNRPDPFGGRKSLLYCTICRISVCFRPFVRYFCSLSFPVFHICCTCGEPMWKTLWRMWKTMPFPQLSPGSPNFPIRVKQENLWESGGFPPLGVHVFHRKTTGAPKNPHSQMIVFFRDSARFPQGCAGPVRQNFVKYPQNVPYQTNVSGNTEIVTNSVGEAPNRCRAR